MPDPTAAEHTWNRFDAPRAADPPVRRSVLRRFGVAAVVAAVGGVLAGMVTWYRPPPAPYFVPLWVTQYRSPVLPPVPWAEADREAVLSAGFFTRGPDAYASQESVLLLRELRSLATLPAGEQVVVYLSGYAVAASDGGVDVYPADVDPAREPVAVPLADILRRVAECPAVRKLLVLDLSEPTGATGTGAIRADCPARIPGLLAKVTPGVQVLVSCGPGQVPLAMPARGRTAFGYYFERGLRGAARAFHRPDHPRNRLISAHELARYVQARVDRWAWENRGVRQTPQLLDEGTDFDLTSTGRQVDETPPAAAAAVPPWVADGWAELDRWRAAGTLSEAPRLYRRLQAAVRRADLAARGPAPDRAADALRFARGRVNDDLRQVRQSVPRPVRPASLALAEAYGARPDPALRQAAGKLLADARAVPVGKPDEAQAALAKLAAGFKAQTAAASAFAVEDALFDAAVESGAGRPDQLRLVAGLLRDRGGVTSVEGQFLLRLADVSQRGTAVPWSADLARDALRTVRQAEQAVAQPDLYPWAGGVMEECAQAKAEGELLLAAWGDVPAEAVAGRFRRAHLLADAVLTFGDALRQARRAADESLAALPDAAEYLDAHPDREPRWQERAAATAALLPALAPPPAPLAVADLIPRGDDLRRRAEALRRAAEEFRAGTPADAAGRLVGQAARPDAGPTVLARIEATLALADMPAGPRSALDAARADLARRLDADTQARDDHDDADGVATRPPPLSPSEVTSAREAEARRAVRRARCEIELLRLAGLPDDDRAALDRLRSAAEREGPDAPAWDQLAVGLRRAWGAGLRAVLAEADADRLDVLAFLYPGADPAAQLDDVPGGSRLARRREAATAYLAWLGDRYRYAARAGFASDFYEAAFADLGVTGRPAGHGLEVREAGAPVVLSTERPIGEARLALLTPLGQRDRPRADVLLPDGYAVRATAEVADAPPDPVDTDVRRFDVRVKVDATGTIPPAGIVVECRAGGRAVFARVPIAFGQEAAPLDVIVSADPAAPTDVGDVLRLRPSETPQPLRLFVRNRGDGARPVAVRVSGPLPAVEAKASPGLGETVPLRLPAPPPPAGGPAAANAIDLPSAMRLELLSDDKSPAVLRDRSVRLAVADPLEYLEVTAAAFEPAAPPDRPANRLRFTLRSRRAHGSAPCTAELVLDPADIPGFGGAKVARLKGTVPADGTPLTLQAEGLALDSEADEDGAVSLTLDGTEHALRYRVTFARSGQPTVPWLDTEPRVRVRLEPPPAPGQSVRFRAAADRGPAGSRLDAYLLRTDADGSVVTEREVRLPAPRQARAAVAVADGAIQLTPSLRDWEVTWDTPQLVGRRTLRVRLLSADGAVLATVDRPLTLDRTPPTGVRLVGLPAKAKKGEPLRVRAEGADRESGVAAVRFYLGKSVKGQPPDGATAVPGKPVANTPGTWEATLTPTGDRADVTVEVENGAGLVERDTGTVELVAELPAAPGIITGTVVEGGRPQANLDVTLSDAKGAAVKTVKTRDDGTFRFDGLAAGKYTVSAAKSASRRTARQPVAVEAGKTASVTLNLFR